MSQTRQPSARASLCNGVGEVLMPTTTNVRIGISLINGIIVYFRIRSAQIRVGQRLWDPKWTSRWVNKLLYTYGSRYSPIAEERHKCWYSLPRKVSRQNLKSWIHDLRYMISSWSVWSLRCKWSNDKNVHAKGCRTVLLIEHAVGTYPSSNKSP